MAWIDAMIPALHRQRDEIISDTWGHLAPIRGKQYKCEMLFTQSECGNLVCIRSTFTDEQGEELGGSPWLQQHIDDFVYENAKEEGKVYMFKGTYRMISANASKYKFTGRVTEASCLSS